MRMLSVLLAVLTLAVLPPSAAASGLAQPASLRDHAMIDRDVITLGDLFDAAGAAADAVVAYAPAPGRRRPRPPRACSSAG